ncbi:MAG TPA: radical SAM protein [Bacillota bacterium]|nr:radical SAM protein [Bacillota bacterium]
MAPSNAPGYARLAARGELAARAREAMLRLRKPCSLCPRRCRVDRSQGQHGVCRTGNQAVVASYGPHYGEERPLVGSGGSGTIFFANCPLRCMYCQNADISWGGGSGIPVEPAALARIMLRLQAAGCHNINLVTPTHVTPMILAALAIAADRGLVLPLVYNCGGYESAGALELLDGLVDIYLPDVKYADDESSRRLSRAPDYPRYSQEAIREMHRQVGDLQVDDRGVARKGLLVRHLVLPGGLAGTAAVARFLAQEVSCGTVCNVMDQYRPAHRAHAFPPLDRRVTPGEYAEALAAAQAAGLSRAGRL